MAKLQSPCNFFDVRREANMVSYHLFDESLQIHLSCSKGVSVFILSHK